jgi:hypothetical protein
MYAGHERVPQESARAGNRFNDRLANVAGWFRAFLHPFLFSGGSAVMSVRRILAPLSVLLIFVAGGANGVQVKKYTAKALLLIAPSVPIMLHPADQKLDLDEFTIFRNTQAQLLRGRFVMQAALRNQKLRNVPSIVREDAKHDAVEWLTKQIHVNFPDDKSCIMEVSATLPDPHEAATIVNAVVDAYMDEVVNVDRQKRRERYESLQRIAADKEEEVRRKREQLKREMESIGAGNDKTVGMRGQLAVNLLGEYQRRLLLLKQDRNAQQARLEELKAALRDLSSEKISELEISKLLYGVPGYRELATRKVLHDLDKLRGDKVTDAAKEEKGTKTPSGRGGENRRLGDDELKAVDRILDGMHAQCLDMLREARRLEVEREVNRLTVRINIATQRIIAFEKEVESKARDADSVGRTSISAQMLRADLESVERILRGVVDERGRLRIELQTLPRVTVLGDKNAPAAVPENPE